jgi:hypothetical protein
MADYREQMAKDMLIRAQQLAFEEAQKELEAKFGSTSTVKPKQVDTKGSMPSVTSSVATSVKYNEMATSGESVATSNPATPAITVDTFLPESIVKQVSTPNALDEDSFNPSSISTVAISEMPTMTPPKRMAKTTTTYRPSLRDVEQKVSRERELMFEEPILPSDPMDSIRLAKPLGRANRRKVAATMPTTTLSPDASLLQKALEEEEKKLRRQIQEEKIRKQEEELARSAYGVAKSITPAVIPVPKMPGYDQMMAQPESAGPMFLPPMGTVSGVPKGSSFILTLNMQTVEGVAITAGLIGSGRCFSTSHLTPKFLHFDFSYFKSFSFPELELLSFLLGFVFAGLLVAFFLTIRCIRRRVRRTQANPEV